MTNVKHIAYENGQIRDAQGKLTAFYDAELKELHIGGIVQTIPCESMEVAMEIVGSHA